MSWFKDAACVELDASVFFPEQGRGGAFGYGKGREVCAGCPVRVECLHYALDVFVDNDDFGMWGGTTPKERRPLRMARRAERFQGECVVCRKTTDHPVSGLYCSQDCQQVERPKLVAS